MRGAMRAGLFFGAGLPVALGLGVARAHGEDAPPSGAPLLIVAPSRFHAALEPYLIHKSERRTTELVALEAVLARSPGLDDPEKLKHFLYQRWNTPGPDGAVHGGLRFVLLVGDADALPVR